jgi:succinate dehydrogenase / fumarate reductase flavoprotein subunit
MGAAEYIGRLGPKLPVADEAEIEAAQAEALAPLARTEGENPYTVHGEVQETMSNLVGIIRTETEIKKALSELEALDVRADAASAEGGSAYNPGWHLALDLRNIMLMAKCVATAALERQESRGGHTRDDYPGMRPEWRKINLVCTLEGDDIIITRQPTPRMRDDLIALFDPNELKKYMTEEEVAALPPLVAASPTGAVGTAAATEEKH